LEYENPTPAGDSRNKTFAAEEKILKQKIRTRSDPVLKGFFVVKKNTFTPFNYHFFFFLQYSQIFQFWQCPFQSTIDVAVNVTFPQLKMTKIFLGKKIESIFVILGCVERTLQK